MNINTQRSEGLNSVQTFGQKQSRRNVPRLKKSSSHSKKTRDRNFNGLDSLVERSRSKSKPKVEPKTSKENRKVYTSGLNYRQNQQRFGGIRNRDPGDGTGLNSRSKSLRQKESKLITRKNSLKPESMLRGLSQIKFEPADWKKIDPEMRAREEVKKEISRFREMAERGRKNSKQRLSISSDDQESEEKICKKNVNPRKKESMIGRGLPRAESNSGYQKSIMDNVLYLGEKELKQFLTKGKKSALTIR